MRNRKRDFDARTLFLPGTFVEDERTNQRGTSLVPSHDALANMPDEHSIYVRWDKSQRESWVNASRLRRVHSL